MNCGACLSGYTGYPQCSLKCTAANCSYHASTFSGTAASGCTCNCRNAWRGDNCSICPDFFNPDPDCVTCLPGYAGVDCTTRVCDVVADCLRAMDVFTARPEVDATRLAAVGMDLAAIATALRPETPFMLVTSLTLRAAVDRAPRTQAYPLQELNDYGRTHPRDAETVAATLSLFDPLAFAPRITARSLLTCNSGEFEYVEPVIDAMAGEGRIEFRTGRGFLDHQVEERWLEQELGA